MAGPMDRQRNSFNVSESSGEESCDSARPAIVVTKREARRWMRILRMVEDASEVVDQLKRVIDANTHGGGKVR